MDHSFIWLVTGIVLVIAELVTGTFYLLFLGIAAIRRDNPNLSLEDV